MSVKDDLTKLEIPGYEPCKPSIIFRLRQKIRDVKFWFLHRFHPKCRYNIVKTGLPAGYYDQDVRMEYAIAAIVVDYVNEESQIYNGQWEPGPEDTHYSNFLKLKGYAEIFQKNFLEDDFGLDREEFTKILHDIINIRGSMWV